MLTGACSNPLWQTSSRLCWAASSTAIASNGRDEAATSRRHRTTHHILADGEQQRSRFCSMPGLPDVSKLPPGVDQQSRPIVSSTRVQSGASRAHFPRDRHASVGYIKLGHGHGWRAVGRPAMVARVAALAGRDPGRRRYSTPVAVPVMRVRGPYRRPPGLFFDSRSRQHVHDTSTNTFISAI